MKIANLKQANDLKQDALMEMERHGFLLKTLCNATPELSSLEDTEKMTETFLLISMGTLGVTHGFVLILDTDSLKGKVISRGLEDRDIHRLYESAPQIITKYFPNAFHKDHLSPVGVRLLPRSGLPDKDSLPLETKALIQWTPDEKQCGLMGLGAKIRTEDYGEEDIEFLLGLANSLMVSIKNVRSMTIIRQLNLDLQQKNVEQHEALNNAARIQKELDGRIFHLNALYDTTHELIGLNDTKKIMETFLLMAMGTFSAEKGYIVLLDSIEKQVFVVYRGIEKEEVIRPRGDDIERTLPQFLETAKTNELLPMKAQMVPPEKLADNPACPIQVSVGLLFSIDDTCQGVVGLGGKITEQTYSSQEQELLQTLVNNFMVFLGNVRSFETVQKLNVDLEKRNVQLNKTIDELSASTRRIEVLEKAKSQVKHIIQKEMERAWRVSVVDIILILVVALGLGIISNFSKPEGIKLIPGVWLREPSLTIGVHEAKVKYDAGASLFVDARPSDFYKQMHIDGAINLPLSLFDFVYMMKFSKLDLEREIIVYGRNISRHYDEEVAFKLASRGHANVKVLSGGLPAWQEKTYPSAP
ncbi:MAG: rhodanese-like domain-containing protein [Candidatus Bathyarchaeota archaeon]|nr:MAG: rhodanese-like domain-containing protein [Candidatus Bathyarchaeota archaeon]